MSKSYDMNMDINHTFDSSFKITLFEYHTDTYFPLMIVDLIASQEILVNNFSKKVKDSLQREIQLVARKLVKRNGQI